VDYTKNYAMKHTKILKTSQSWLWVFLFFGFMVQTFRMEGQIYTGSIHLSNQAQVDAFAFTEVTGNLSIGGSLNGGGSDITNLDGLVDLTSVGGGLSVGFNPLLTNIDGLANLSSSVGGISINHNTSLTNVDGLSSVTSIGSQMIIWSNDALLNLDGLASLTSIGGEVWIGSNNVLTNIDGLGNLTSVGGAWMDITFNPQLSNLDGLRSLISVGGNLTILDNYLLTDLDGLAALTTLVGTLWIQYNISLDRFCGLFNLLNEGWTGPYEVYNNKLSPTIAEILNGGPCFCDEDPIFLTSQTEVDAFSACSNIPFKLNISGADITNLDGLAGLTYINDLNIYDNPMLTNLDGLSGLANVDILSISNNPMLADIDGLSSLKNAFGVSIDNNDALTNVDGLVSLTDYWGDPITIVIDGNDNLINLDGLSSLSHVWSLDVINNISLIRFCGLSSAYGFWGGSAPGVPAIDISGNALNPTISEIKTAGLCFKEFTLVNAITNQDIGFLVAGEIIDLTLLPTNQLNVRANLEGPNVESVRFALNGTPNYQTESIIPYALEGDNNGDYNPLTITPGIYTISATPFSKNGAKGTKGDKETITITFSNGPVVTTGDFTLINVVTDQPIGPLDDGDVVDLATLPAGKFTVRANMEGPGVESVRFGFDGQSNYNTENIPPYALAGDINGNYFGLSLAPGAYTISATPYSQNNAVGTAGTTKTITITIIDSNQGSRLGNSGLTMNLYPNPTQTKFTLDLANVEAGKLDIQVYNVNGALVRHQTEDVVSGTYVKAMSLLNLPSGLYIVKVLNGATSSTGKILKQ
jgi:hypothetical protein